MEMGVVRLGPEAVQEGPFPVDKVPENLPRLELARFNKTIRKYTPVTGSG